MSENAKQRTAVLAVMGDGKFWTLFELDQELRNRGRTYLTTSISARLRELRNPKFGGWIVERRLRHPAVLRTFEYSVKPHVAEQQDLFRGAA
jgi:hypothetical protein